MIVRSFIFVHIPRNAGTSITKTLRPFSSRYSFNDHKSALEITKKIGCDEFQSSFSFAIVRNPWDRQVSFYSYVLRDRAHHLHRRTKACGSFREYVKRVLLPGDTCVSRLQKSYVYSGRTRLVCLIGRFEALEKWFKRIRLEISLPDALILLKLNVSAHRSYRECYDEETKRTVGKVFEQDVDAFGYEF